MRNLDIEKIEIGSGRYPENLMQIDNPPKQLYCCGDISLLKEKSIAIVGSRKFTVYGKTVAKMIGRRLAENDIPVVSGLAYGIDGFAHEAVADTNGRGIAVLGSGIGKMSPRSNYELMLRLIELGGLVISEYSPDMSAEKFTFPQRNRIISGLSEAVVVVEANFNSGALITAQFANEQGKQIYAVPGNINSQFSMGSNLLIRDGAMPLVVIDDVVRAIKGDISSASYEDISLGDDEKAIMNVVKRHNGVSIDTIATSVGMTVGKVNSIVTILEIKGAVISQSGKIHLAK